MPNIKQINNLDQKFWFKHPSQGHLVQFYNEPHLLHKSLLDYFVTGISQNETCIAIATPEVLHKLNQGLSAQGFDVDGLSSEHKIITLDAEQTLRQFMVGHHPDWQLFQTSIGKVMKAAQADGRPIRAFGEMVAILWKQGKADAVLELEEFWNDLGDIHNFSLFCAYPFITFDINEHRQSIQAIHKRHSNAFPVYSGFRSL